MSAAAPASRKPPPRSQVPWHRPRAWLYYPLAFLSLAGGALVFGLRIRRDPVLKKLRGPLVVLGNHPCYADPFFMAVAMLPKRINFLTAHGFFRSRFIGAALHTLGALPKTQFRTDMQAMRGMLGVIRSGGVLAIYPEGQRSLDGSIQPIDEAIAKLISKMRCPVVAVVEDGAYLSWPRWSKSGIRRGRIELRARLLFTPEQLAGMAVPAIQAEIEKALHYQDYDWQRRHPRRFASRAPAAGLHHICHRCPACGRDLAMQSSRDQLTCRFCGNSGKMDRFGFIAPTGETSRVFTDPWQWHRWQLAEMKKQLQQPDFRLELRAGLDFLAEDGAVTPGGKGLLRLEKRSLRFDGEGGLQVQFPIGSKTGISADFGLQFELILADRNYRFTLEDGQAVILLADAIAALAATAANRAEGTPSS